MTSPRRIYRRPTEWLRQSQLGPYVLLPDDEAQRPATTSQQRPVETGTVNGSSGSSAVIGIVSLTVPQTGKVRRYEGERILDVHDEIMLEATTIRRLMR